MADEPGRWTWGSIFWKLGFGNVMDLRDQLSSTIGFLPKIWAFMMKQVLPHIILILFINLARSNNSDGESLFGNYGNYVQWPFQVLGYLSVIFAFFLFLLGLVAPSAYDGLTLIDDKIIMHAGTEGKEVEEKVGDDPENDVDELGKDKEAGDYDAGEVVKEVEEQAVAAVDSEVEITA